jgi:hypothetical protein
VLGSHRFVRVFEEEKDTSNRPDSRLRTMKTSAASAPMPCTSSSLSVAPSGLGVIL